MTCFGTFAMRSAAALLCVAPLPSAASEPARDAIHVLCDSAREPPFCAALADAVAAAHPERTVLLQDGSTPAPNRLSIAFVEENANRDGMSGHLIWIDPEGQRGSGPTLTLSVMDAQMNRDMLNAFAMQMLRHSALPL